MKKSTPASILIVALIAGLGLHLNAVVLEGPKEVESWFETLKRDERPDKMTRMHFYFHEQLGGENVSAAGVAQANGSWPFAFGNLISADDPLTVGPGWTSKRVGHLKGLYGTTSLEEVGLMMAMSFVFTDEIYNGSSLSILGYNPDRNLYRELPIVGGSGRFRLARGVATLQTYNYYPAKGNATIEIDLVILHY